jgi:flagellum-specific peptidoglycan hydrolase FlgJ
MNNKRHLSKYAPALGLLFLLAVMFRACFGCEQDAQAVLLEEAQPELSRKLHSAYATIQRLQNELDSVTRAGTPQDWYILTYADAAKETQRTHGVPACITLAQGLLESSAGQSSLATKHNNHFGIKCFSRKCAKGHCTNLHDDSHKDFFKCYADPWQSFLDHAEFLQRPHYAKRTKGLTPNQWKQYAHALADGGYATDPTYAAKLCRIIKKYRLYEYN